MRAQYADLVRRTVSMVSLWTKSPSERKCSVGSWLNAKGRMTAEDMRTAKLPSVLVVVEYALSLCNRLRGTAGCIQPEGTRCGAKPDNRNRKPLECQEEME